MISPQYAVVGHLEWLDFIRLEHLPQAGEIVTSPKFWDDIGGGGSVAAVQLVKLGARVHFFTALGDDELGRRSQERLRAMGVEVHACFRPQPTRRAITFLNPGGERTIVVLGPRLAPQESDPLPWERLAECRGVYITAGDRGALRQARQARTVVGTSRILDDLLKAEMPLEGLVGSRNDARERFDSDALPQRIGLRVLTESDQGGIFWNADGTSGRYSPTPLCGPAVDAYGCGDNFAAGLTWALGEGMPPAAALELAATCGAACMTGAGPYAGQLHFSNFNQALAT